MSKIFIGFILIFLDFNLNLGNSQIGLLPDFIGYIMMINGIDEMALESPLFMKVKPYATFMAVYSGIIYLLDLLGISLGVALAYLIGLMSTAISLYISYNIIIGVIDIEDRYSKSLNGSTLKSTWTLFAIFSILTMVSLFFPVLAVISALISFVTAICFLFAFNKSKNYYYSKV